MNLFAEKIAQKNINIRSLSANEGISTWQHILKICAQTAHEKALCHLALASYLQRTNKDTNLVIAQWEKAKQYLTLPNDIDDLLILQHKISEQLLHTGDYKQALQEYIRSAKYASEFGYVTHYVNTIIGMGNLCDTYGNHQRALRYYQKIDDIAYLLDGTFINIKYKLYKVSCLIQLKEFITALKLLDECEQLNGSLGSDMVSSQIHLYHAQILRCEEQYYAAMKRLTLIQYKNKNDFSTWLSVIKHLEIAQCLSLLDKHSIASTLLSQTKKHIIIGTTTLLTKRYFSACSNIYAAQGLFKQALRFEKKSFQIDSELINSIPINDLGSSQQKRLNRLDLQLKLTFSETENLRLKESSRHQQYTVDQLQHDAFTDALTQLHNRRWLDEKINQLTTQSHFCFLIIDIDHFKSINDEFSHLAGDKAIKIVANLMKKIFIGENTTCVRFGGEEFLIILENTSVQEAKTIAEHYRSQVYSYPWDTLFNGRTLTVSTGISEHTNNELPQRTFYRADQALYQAKRRGRNQICMQ